ncbi:histidine kinase [Chitinivorax sp. B]|uniref:GAF domain-containing protein n=1 Tax=Chitinivorax sp. B TaxID=2502235 RepID=UPI0010F8B26D|nr:histidine kinase [Chitinivorax sp. B]
MTELHVYLERAGLATYLHDAVFVEHCEQAYSRLMDCPPLTLDGVKMTYPVPMLSEDGSCSLFDELAPTPFDLRSVLGGDTTENRYLLAHLDAWVEQVQRVQRVDWVGIYQKRQVAGEVSLVKMVYRGNPSRAVFPLTDVFAAHSTNSLVGLSGRARIIGDVGRHVASGGAYYTCDPAVQAEACLPILGRDGAILGIIDAEDVRPGFFDVLRLAELVALCLMSAEVLERSI